MFSRATLTPPLQTNLRTLRFSPDGKRILLQDESMIYVLSRSPLAVELAAPNPEALPARFTVDSSSIVMATRDMRVQGRSIADRKVTEEKTLGAGSDCDYAALSPMGSYYACLDARQELHVYETSSGTEIYVAKPGQESLLLNAIGMYRMFSNLPRSEPFGYILGAHNPPPLQWVAGANLLRFSPDERFILAFRYFGGMTAADLKAKQRVILSGALKREAVQSEAEFVAPGRVVAMSRSKPNESILVSFPEGQVLDNLGIAGSARATSDPDLVVHSTPDGKTVDLFEISKHKLIAHVARGGTDYFGGEIASYSVADGLELVRAAVGQKPSLATIVAGPLPGLHTALASPDLSTLIVSANGQGAAYRVADGTEIANFPGLRGAWFDNDEQATIGVPEEEPQHSDLDSFRTANGATAILWRRVDQFFNTESIASGPVMLELQRPFADIVSREPLASAQLRAFDIQTGKQLWMRDPGREHPLPFTDPQGERVVLGWDAKTEHARGLAKHSKVVQQNMKAKKVTDHDTLFEILNARTGATEGVAYVPGGTGPQGYTSAYSAGNWLIIVKDDMRITARFAGGWRRTSAFDRAGNGAFGRGRVASGVSGRRAREFVRPGGRSESADFQATRGRGLPAFFGRWKAFAGAHKLSDGVRAGPDSETRGGASELNFKSAALLSHPLLRTLPSSRRPQCRPLSPDRQLHQAPRFVRRVLQVGGANRAGGPWRRSGANWAGP
jgi:hypothetical protein